jgi:hypothetical protein
MFAKALIAAMLLTSLVASFAAAAQESQPQVAADATRASIVNSGSTNSEGYSLTVAADGSAIIVQGDSTLRKQIAAAPVTRLFADLRAAGSLDALLASPCMKSISFGTTTRVLYLGKSSPDLSCPTSDPALKALALDVTSVIDAAGIRTILPRH